MADTVDNALLDASHYFREGWYEEAKSTLETLPRSDVRVRQQLFTAWQFTQSEHATEDQLLEWVLDDPSDLDSATKLIGYRIQIPSTLARLDEVNQLSVASRLPTIQARSAVLHLTQGNLPAARQAAQSAILNCECVKLRAVIRRALASVFSWYGRIDLAERMMLSQRTGSELHSTIWDIVRLRKDTILNDVTSTYLAFARDNASKFQASAANAWLDYIWQLSGATAALKEAVRYAPIHGRRDDYAMLRACMSFEAGNIDVASRLVQGRNVAAWIDRLPIATLVTQQPELGRDLSKPDIEYAERLSELHEFIVEQSNQLDDWLRTSSLRIAVVGNSPVLIGRGQGLAIDEHDCTVRFNGAPQNAEDFKVDCGSRTDIHVMPTKGSPDIGIAADARYFLMTVPSAIYRNASWGQALRLKRNNLSVTAIRGPTYGNLARQLKAPPSNGLRVIAWLSDLRGDGRKADLFGFSMVDQINHASGSANFFRSSRPSMHHNWAKEREILDGMSSP